ncbi:MAG: TonB-dependent receptor [Cyclobacteriaceae bacterium]
MLAAHPNDTFHLGEKAKFQSYHFSPLGTVDVTVTGTVVDSNGEPIPGVTVSVPGTTIGTATDLDGAYSISVPEGATLVFSFIGFESQRIDVGDQSVIDITMTEDMSSLDEVVVVGFGTQKKSDITGSISSLSAKDLGNSTFSNVMEQAQGRLAGVDIIRTNGTPGSDVQIRVRGNRSISAGNDPLFVIDGIPTTLSLNDFNPNDIESMEVLKDASSVAIYGSRGANGVILITTKKGKRGDAKISYSGSYAIQKPFENLDPMNPQEFVEYVRVANGLNRNDASQDNTILSSEENYLSGIDPDWLGLGLRNGWQHQHQISISGGSEKVNYYLSGSLFDEQGIIKNSSSFSRNSFRANIEVEVTKNLTIGLNSMVATSVQELMQSQFNSQLISVSPLASPYDADGNLLQYPNDRVEAVNPLYYLDPSQYKDETSGNRVFANLFAEYKLHQNLTYRMNFGPDIRSSKRGQYEGLLLGEGINSATVTDLSEFNYNFENILTYNKIINDHSINVVGLFSLQESKSQSLGVNGVNLPIEKAMFYDLGSANNISSINSSLEEWSLLSYMGRINYKFKEKYLMSVSGRADGSSRLAEGNKWGFFPSAAVGWIVSEENFYSGNFLNFMKLRVGYGEVGNTAIRPYQTLGGLTNTNYAFGDSQAFGFGMQVIPNPDLRWEISKTLNIGFDYGFLNDRVSGSIELYNTNTQDLLLNRFLPITSGYSSIVQNIGSTRNRGIEFSASTYIFQNTNDGFNWNVDLNLFSNKEEIVSLTDSKNDDVGNRWFIGQPINVFYSFLQEGIWQAGEVTEANSHGQAPGDIKIADINGRDELGQLTNQSDGVINQDDRTVLGSTVPTWSGGMTNRFSYKGFTLSVLVFARQGQMLQSNYHNMGGNDWQGRHGKINLNYWTPDNPSNEIPMPIAARSPLYGDAVTYFDASFVKIKNISLGYTLDNKLTSRIRSGSSIRIYTTLDNSDMLTFSKFKRVDPEQGTGMVGGGIPLTTTNIIFGLNVNF